MKKPSINVLATFFLIAFAIISCGPGGGTTDTKKPGGLTTQVLLSGSPAGVVYTPPDTSIFEGPGVIQGWVDKFDDAAIYAHAWELWGGITALTEQSYPSADTAAKYNIPTVKLALFNTWWSEYEVFNPPAPPASATAVNAPRNMMPFHSPRQASAKSGTAAAEAHSGDVLSFNKYTQEFKDYVADNKFYYLKTLMDMQAAGKSSVPQTFEPRKSMMLKPTFIFASSTEPVLIPYWKGPGMTVAGTTSPTRPVSSTWTQWVLFNPTTNAVKSGTPFKTQYAATDGTTRDTTITSYEVVGLKDFYWIPLTPEDIRYLRAGNVFTTGGITLADLKPGDLSLMVACHVTSIEFFEDWTWQTFWWTPHPSKTPPASANVKPPFDHYDVEHSYYMIGKDKKPFISQNPYLEPSIITPIVKFDNFSKGLGVKSNCMSCHHAAAFPTANMDPSPAHSLIGSYIGAGQVDADNPILTNRLNTNFMWTVVLLKQSVFTPDNSRDSFTIYKNSQNK